MCHLTSRAPARSFLFISTTILTPLVAFALAFFAAPTAARSQDLDDVTVSGVVTDEHGARVVGAAVTASFNATGAARRAPTDAEGRYRLVELPPGAYTLRVEAPGFAAAEQPNVRAVAGQQVRLDFTLRPAGVVAEQTISGETAAARVDTTRTVVGGTITREELEQLPVVTRAPLDLIFTLGGVTEEPLSVRDAAEDRDPRAGLRFANATPEEAGTFALSGGPAYSNNLTVDGLDNNDDRAARERFQPSLEAVEEVQVITNQFSAEYGRASGGRVNLRTRGGTRQFRGRLFYFFRDESLNANSYFNNARGLKRLPLQQHNPGFTLGGPVFNPFRGGQKAAGERARSFFFVAYEHDALLDSALIDTLVPVGSNPSFPLPQPTTLAGRRREPSATAPREPAELAPFIAPVNTPLRNHTLTARLDHNFTDTHNGALLFQLGRFRNLRQFGGGSRLADALQGRTRDTEALAYTDNFVFDERAVNQLRAQVSRLRPSLKAGGAARPVVLITINDPLAADDPADRSGTLVAGSSSAGASDRREERWQVQDTLTLLRGAHTFRLGGDVQRIRSTFVDLADAGGTYSFTSAGDFLAGAPSRFRQRFGNESVQRNTYAGLFAQDEWRLRPNLVLSFGLRYDNESIIRDRNNFAPRAALAYDPFATGKTVVRLGAGVFYNRALLRTVDDFTLGQSRVVFDTNALRDPATGRVMSDAQRRAFIAAHLSFPGVLAADAPLVRRYGAPQAEFARRLDPALRIPESYQANLGVERQLGRNLILEANYTFNRGLHLWREFNANAPRLPRGFRDFTQYLLSRDFPNFRDATGTRPLYNTQSAGELVRFVNAPFDAVNPDAVGRVVEFGVPVSVFNLNSFGSTSAPEAALAALNNLRPDPSRGQVEQLVSAGNSFYHGLTLEARRRFASHGAGGFGLSLRAAYTLSRLIDDGVVNTSSALVAGDFRRERARSLLDRRHRFVLSGTLELPRHFGALRFAPILRVASGAPFNLSLGGADRNLDDVGNDRPSFDGDLRALRARRPGEPLAPHLLEALSLPPIGGAGNLPRNAGRGPALFTFDLSVTREFRAGSRLRLRPTAEFDNVLNKTVFTFGAEFVNFNALRPGATPEQRRAFLDTFLVPARTLRPRSVRLGLRIDF